VTEIELLRAVARLCVRYSVLLDHRHLPVYVYDLRGWPDCSLLGTKATAFRELKNATRAVTEEQQQVGKRMLQSGLDWGVWRPRHYESGTIEREIAALVGRKPW